MPEQEDREPAVVGGDLVHGDKFDMSGTFTGMVNIGSTINYHTAPATPAADTRPRIFLSYSWDDDKPFVERLQANLQAAGFDVWRDETDLKSRGPDLSQELIREIDGRERFVPVIGPAAFTRPAVQSEWSHAIQKCKAITPVWRLGDREPPADFKAKLYVDFRDSGPGFTYQDRLAHLAGLLADRAETPGRFLTRFPELPPGVIPRKQLEPLRQILDPLPAGGTTVAITGLSAARTVQAPGGLGKSVLAAIFGRECRTRWAFADGLVWLTVGKTPVITALQAELGALFGDKPDQYTSEIAGQSCLQRLLHDRKVLIVLDDVWNYHHVEPLVVDAPGCRWLITTRLETITDGLGLPRERVIKLEYLSDDEGLELIARRLETTVERLTDRAACLAIVRELGGHTQAVAIAAARLRQGLPPPQLLDRYRRARDGNNPLALLNLEEKRELNLELSFGESYEFMDVAGRRRLRLLGVFAPEGTFDAAAAAAVWEEDEDAAGDALRELVGASLLTTTADGRYEQHGLIRAYALGLLRRAGEEEETRAHHFHHFFQLYSDHVRNKGYEDAGWHDQITTDFADISHSLDWAYKVQPELACRLVVALQGTYLQFRQPVETRLAWLQRAHEAAKASGYRLGEANTLKAIGDVQNFRDDRAAALASYEAALGLFRAVGARLGEANTLKAIGDVQNFRKELEAALASYEAALGLFRAVGTRLGEANTLKAIGDVQNFRDDREAALASYEAALGLYRAVGARLGEANTLKAIGDVQNFRDDRAAALASYEAALGLFRAVGARLGEANTLKAIGDVQNFRKELEAALASYEAALGLFRAVGDRLGEANTLQAIGDVQNFRDDREAALASYEAALGLFRAVGDRLGEANTLQAIGDVQNFRDDREAALASYEAALGLFRAVGARLGEANTLKAIGDVQNFRKELEAALASYEAALGLYRAVGDRVGEANTIMALGHLERNQANYEAARARYEQARPIYAAIGAMLGGLNVVFGIADVDRAQGNYPNAAAGYRQALLFYKQIGSPFNTALAYQRLGLTARDTGDREEARRNFQLALEIYKAIGAPSVAIVADELESL